MSIITALQTCGVSSCDAECTFTSSGGCTDTCTYANDGTCDDGGAGSELSLCSLGTDCGDCGPR
jgi:hypothetical protein